jgi:hypothetical protein
MNYQRIYSQIIERAQKRQLEGYVEKHHIIPKCLEGNNDRDNIVQLTAREHFMCHRLLCEIYPYSDKLKYALYLMNIGKQKHREANYQISSRTYERLKLEHSLFLIGKKQKDKTKQKKSESMKLIWANKTDKEKNNHGIKIWNTKIKNGTNNITEQHAKNISKALKGRKITWDRGRNQIIEQYDLQNNFIKNWPSIAEAERQIRGDIQACCKGKQKTAGGFIWKIKTN